MRFLPLILTLAILVNTSLILFFRLKLDREYNEQLATYERISEERNQKFFLDTLRQLDTYFPATTNNHSTTTSNNTILSPSVVSSDLQSRTIILPYHVYYLSGSPYIRFGSDDYTIGDIFPLSLSPIISISSLYVNLANGLIIQNSQSPNNPSSLRSTNTIPSPQIPQLGNQKNDN